MVEFVNCFEVPPGAEDSFFVQWQQVNAYMAAKPGYVSHRLHRALRDDASFTFINVARWESVEAWERAHDAGLRERAAGIASSGVRPIGALYEIIHEGTAPGLS